MRYAKALPEARPTMDLSGLSEDLRTTLLTMDDHELKALAQAGVGAIRKFVAGENHGVLGENVGAMGPGAIATNVTIVAGRKGRTNE